MEVIYPRAAGLDIHLKLIVACRITPGEGSRVQREVRSFGTTTAAIGQLADWLAAGGVTHVAMEATGVYWKPIYNLLENRFELILANAQHIKAVPGRKTDVQLRHEVVQIAVGPEQPGPNRVFCHSYPTVACGWSNSMVRSPRDNVALFERAILKP
jgi:transposase